MNNPDKLRELAAELMSIASEIEGYEQDHACPKKPKLEVVK